MTWLPKYDLMDQMLRLSDSRQEIETQAFVDVDVDRVIVPKNVHLIADDAFDEDVLLVLPDSRLEGLAKEKHPNYWISLLFFSMC